MAWNFTDMASAEEIIEKLKMEKFLILQLHMVYWEK